MEHCDVIDYSIREKKTLLECGEGNGSRTFTPLSNNQPFQIANVTIDASKLCHPIVNIEFSSAVKFEIASEMGVSGIVRLRYELFSSCDGREPLSLGVWLFQKLTTLSVGGTRSETTSFGFDFCECLTCCSRCIEYFVLVNPIQVEATSPSGANEVKATTSNGRMAALVQEK
ncbi:DUF4489 domain-containing protein [Vallitalea okinawensis]|uniref:DUF4489 domain-containing protein n=1 Tax=Vallitalea okinawensis TaxID=2078660 RepID=UPI000CFD142A|nr:DUF4489 domain-containing protein [Vallitalea okinawensis]